MVKSVSKRSRELFDEDLYCAESVLLSIAEYKNIKSGLIPKIATGFCSGVSRTCGMCGAISGGIMALGLFFGRDSGTESTEKCYFLVQELLEIFEKRFGSSNCEKLTGCDLGTDAGQNYFEDNDLKKICFDYVGETAEVTLKLIEENI